MVRSVNSADRSAGSSQFSIYDQVVSHAHRAFYERMLSDLNIVIPVCNHGKSLAIEISSNVAERDQLMGLMKRAETFSRQLLQASGQLFSDFYQAKEDFSRRNYLHTAYIKVNLIDRNLLERTCDVRWWALETSFAQCIEASDEARSCIERIQGVVGRNLPAAEMAIADLEWLSDSAALDALAAPRGRERLRGVLHQLKRMAGPDAEIAQRVVDALEAVDVLERSASFACARLEDIRRSYTLYRDLVITDTAGRVLANSRQDTRSEVLGLCVAEEPWFQAALTTSSGAHYHAEDLCQSTIEPEQASLVYSTAIRRGSISSGPVSGVIGVFFDFQGETRLILDDFLPRGPDGGILDGWYSLLTDCRGNIIASSDEIVFPLYQPLRLPASHRRLKDGQRAASYGVIEGRESAIYSAATDGYLDYAGLGWTSHLIIDRKAVFDSGSDADEAGLSDEAVLHCSLVPEVNRATYEKVQDDKFAIQRISLNGIIFASKLGRRGLSLGPVFEEITRTGDAVTAQMEQLLIEMARGELQLNQQALATAARQAIDLIDRNLFERAADVRWWSTDEYFWKALSRPGPELFQRASERLGVINESYTMYRNLVLADAQGGIVACSDQASAAHLQSLTVASDPWFIDAMTTRESSSYAVQDVSRSELEPDKSVSLIYAGGIRAGGARLGATIGALGILFDWDTEAGTILQACLPRDSADQVMAGCLAVYTDRENRIIESTDRQRAPLGANLPLPHRLAMLARGESGSAVTRLHGQSYLMGSARTRGYREYAGLGWQAHILRPL